MIIRILSRIKLVKNEAFNFLKAVVLQLKSSKNLVAQRFTCPKACN